MYAFSTPRALAYDSRHGHRRIPAALPQPAAGGLDPCCVILAIHDEDRLAHDALVGAGHEADAREGLRLYGEAELAGWPSFPQRLGRLDAKLAVIDEPAPLPAQLAALRRRHPGRRHFRIALLGGFGTNLGDTLLGATAWRAAAPVLRHTLRSIDADVLLGPLAGPALAELVGHEDGIGRVLFESPSLTDFARYDAFFDFCGLVVLPRFHEGAALDWLLWWLGLDPAAVPPAAKRNRLHLPEDALTWARERLAAAPGPRVHFGWRASVPLRSMPDEVARGFAAEFLETAPEVTLVTDQTLGLDHPRLLDLGPEADSAVRMMALVAGCDGLVSVDSLAPHAADAADVPAVMVSATLPPGRFPYYPHMRVVNPPGAEALPGWGQTKVRDPLWPGMRELYRQAWANVSARDCWTLLAGGMAQRSASGDRGAVSWGKPWDRSRSRLPPAGRPFPLDVANPVNRWITGEMTSFAAQVLVPGSTCILAGGGDGALALALARLVAPGGALHVLEPRRLRAQKLLSDAQAAGIASVHLQAAMADRVSNRRPIPDFDPASEADPWAWGNLHGGVLVDAMAIDALPTDPCRTLVIEAPQQAVAALAGASRVLSRDRPLVLAGPVCAAHLRGLRLLLDLAGYQGFLMWPNRRTYDAALLIAAPRESDARFDGFDHL